MSITPLPVFEAEADPSKRSAMSDEEIYASLKPPTSIVVRFGMMKLVGEYPYSGDARPGCGSKLVIRTHRGVELADMLTSTCDNAGCSKSVTRKEMLEYIDNSGGKDYPFYTKGRVMRVATVEDLNAHSALEPTRQNAAVSCKKLIKEMGLDMKLIDAEPILGGELMTFYYMSENRVDFRELVRLLAAEFSTRIEMRQVGARDEARLVADYERCGQHCCCKGFLKVLKPVSMGAAKRQKASLEPLKISGRCGRLMCCLRYEDQTYKELKKNLPNRRTRVGTQFGPGIVKDTKLLVQLVLVKLEHDDSEVAIPVEELMDPETCPTAAEAMRQAQKEARAAIDDPFRGMAPGDVAEKTDDKKRKKRGRRSRGKQQDAHRGESKRREGGEGGGRRSGGKPKGKRDGDPAAEAGGGTGTGAGKKKRRRRRRRPSGAGEGGEGGSRAPRPQAGGSGGGDGGGRPPAKKKQGEGSSDAPRGEGGGPSKKKSSRRRRRGKRGGRGRSGGEGGGGNSGPPNGD